MCLVLGKDATDSICWWIDASYAVHPDMHGHTGATMSMGTGLVFSGSWKQKLVMRSSTESEVVVVYDVLPQIFWTKKFLEDQGVGIKDTVLYQDNMSSMLLERNGAAIQYEVNEAYGYSLLLCRRPYPKQDCIFTSLPYRGDVG